MEAPKCKRCEKKHYGLCSDIQEPLDAATNNIIVATNAEESATNRIVSDKTLNRRDRAKYNEYQRGYMRRRRGGD